MTNIMEAYHKISKNFMTPIVLKVEQYGDRVLELSKGEDLNRDTIYGVTEFIACRSTLETTKRGDMFYSLKEAKKYYSLLKLS